ncbi:MAG TPA: hypothetical protein VGR28_05275 [Candidatus Thermoplasmatota archaeon]|nr:hypothetical protein [Candidatus Thermoplasmatota archaeon]
MRARRLALGLLLLAALGAAVRLAPLLAFEVWGSDTGEYHRLAATLVAEGRLSTAYDGWGIAYPWFPGLYAVAGGVSAMTGLDVRWTLAVLVPALAGLSGVGVALLAYELSRRADAGLLAGAAAAVVMPHAFATSHAMPGALGHVLLLGSLLLAWRAGRERALWVALLVVLLALTATHHLSTYMALLALGGMVFVRGLLVARPATREDRALWGALGVLLATALAWWSWAAPVRDDIAPQASQLGIAGLGLGAALGLALLWWLPRWRARWAWRFRPAYPSTAAGLRLVAAMAVVVVAGYAVVGFVGVPGTSVQIAPLAVLWFLPMALLLGFGFLGSRLAKFRPRGALVYGWALALLASFAVMIAVGSHVLLPYRHAEYILEPAALLAGLGLAAALAAARARGARIGRAAAAGAVVLLLANAALAYPPPSVLAGFQEGTTHAEMDAVRWAGAHVKLAPDAVIAADHRLSSMLFGYAGLDATWEYAPLTFHAATFGEARAEMGAVHAPSGVKRVDYVLLTAPMRAGLALTQWDAASPLSEAAQAKFERDPHYVAVCRSEGAVLYRVDWALDGSGPAAVAPCVAS